MPTDWSKEFSDLLDRIPDTHFDRRRFVPPSGPLDADIVLVGEAPGANEVKDQKPFTGRSGEILDEALRKANITRENIYITSTVKIRPPENRDPHRDELDAWGPLLEAELERVSPLVVVTLGRIAAREVFGIHRNITDIRGTPHELDSDTIGIPTYHPAAILYDRSKHDSFIRDIDTINRYLSN